LNDFLAVAEEFGKEWDRGLRGQTSSLAMKPSRLSRNRKASRGRALVLDAAGTRLRTAVVRWDQGRQELERQTEAPMPGSQGPLGPVTVLNETVATLLAGAGLPEAAAWSSGVGQILGTGTNGCYPEPTRKGEIYNTESGAFRRFPRTELDRALEATTQDPEDYWFEKTMAGASLGPLCSLAVSRLLGRGETWSTTELAQPLALPDGDPVRTMAEDFVDRAAGLWRTGGGLDASRPVGLLAEGSTFWNLPGVAQRFERHLQGLLQGDWHRHYALCQISLAPFWGSVVATPW
jgi:hexokinase